MKNYDDSFCIHLCYPYTWDQRVVFDTGTHNFTVGKTLSGVTSHATGLIKTVSGTTTGYLVLSNVSGVFTNNEVITDDATTPGSALVNGAPTLNDDGYGNKTQTQGLRPYECRFVNAKAPQGNIPNNWSGRFPAVIFPPGMILTEHQRIYTAAPSFIGIYQIQWPPIAADNGYGLVHHITVGLQKVTA